MQEQSPRAGWPTSHGAANCSVVNGLVTLTLSGEIDLLATDALEDALATATTAQPADILIDLAAVTFIGSQALSFLVRLHRLTTENSRLTTLRNVPRSVGKAMVTVGLDQLFTLEEPPSDPAGYRN